MRPGRTPVLVALVLVLVAGGVADRVSKPRLPQEVAVVNRAMMPTAAPAGALSSTWFCVGATAAPASAANGTLSVANPTDRPASGTVTVVPASGETKTTPITVGPRSVTSVKLSDVVTAPYAAALVDLDAGQVGAELVVRGPSESDATPCSSRASDKWYFADGVTAKDASLVLSLFNPFPEDAIVDLTFSTDQGRAAPAAFRPIVVPARTLAVRDIGEHVRRREAIATELVVRTGRVVAAQTQTRSAAGRAGLSVALGAPSLGREWHFPNGVVADGMGERFSVFNPSKVEASVLFQMILDEGVAEDFERAVPARGRVDVVLNEEVGVPRGVGHAVTVRSLDGVAVAVARTMELSSPAATAGRADTLGARRGATRWLFPAGGAGEATDEYVVLSNPGTAPATVSITGLASGEDLTIEGLKDFPLEPGRRSVLRIRDYVERDQLPLVVASSAPVVAERVVYLGASGVWSSMGIPLG